ncbi:hypothetical protein [Mycobacteroides abscessus]|uniref:hypothetical protein n=1 Tax=Mycobacteroides abscessus TaxID=36809 RepID=UPI002103D7E9|nr:hypothetical protein [Mycobacteroides abscessus]
MLTRMYPSLRPVDIELILFMPQIVPKSPDIKAFGALFSSVVLAQGFGTRDRHRSMTPTA